MLRCEKKKKKGKKKKPSLPLGLLYDKEAYKMSYHCVGLIMNIWEPKKQGWGKQAHYWMGVFWALEQTLNVSNV